MVVAAVQGGASQPPNSGSPQQGSGVRVAIAKEPKPNESALVFDKPGDRAILRGKKADWDQANVNVRVRAADETTYTFAPEMEGRYVYVVDVNVPIKTDAGSVRTLLINALAGFKRVLAPDTVARLRSGVLKIFKGRRDPEILRALEEYKALMNGEGADKIKIRVKHEKDIVLGEPAARVRRRARG